MRTKIKWFAIAWLALVALTVGEGFYFGWRTKDVVSLLIAMLLSISCLCYKRRYFRRLASMPTEQREQKLAEFTVEERAKIIQQLKEYVP